MAILYISEYAQLNNDIPAEPVNVDQTVAIGGASVQSAAFKFNTNFVRLSTDAICSVSFGASPTALATSSRMAAGTERIIKVVPGWKVAVITNT